MAPNLKNKIWCDELYHEIGKLPRLANLQTKLKPEEIGIRLTLYCPECCLTNCHYKICQLRTIFVFHQLIPVAVKLVKWTNISVNINRANSTAQRILTNFKIVSHNYHNCDLTLTYDIPKINLIVR